mgnify:CR=1 FL=1
MKLLIITQKVDKNDPILGFFHRWLIEFAKHYEKITVICLQKGEYYLPDNVRVLSLDKENGVSRLKYLWNFYRYIWQERKNYDKVFVHMNPEYVVLAGWWWRLTHKPIALWYTHRQVNLKLRIAEKLSQIIFTAAEKSFRLPSSKVLVVGHGIPVEDFHCPSDKSVSQELIILHVGRITRIKNCDVLIKAGHELLGKITQPIKILFVGTAVTKDDGFYLQELDKLVKDLKMEQWVEFRGSVSPEQIRDYYCQANLSVNLTPTGGIDKAVLESMASGTPVLSSNQSFALYFDKYQKKLLFKERDYRDLSEKINNLLFESEQLSLIGDYLYRQVNQKSSLQKLISMIIEQINKL